MVTSKKCSPGQDEKGNSTGAVIVLNFSRLWELFSPHQKQYALHLADPITFTSQYAPEGEFPYCSWDILPPHIRILILESFRELPDVHSVSWTRN